MCWHDVPCSCIVLQMTARVLSQGCMVNCDLLPRVPAKAKVLEQARRTSETDRQQ
jgi:hypothetical protein